VSPSRCWPWSSWMTRGRPAHPAAVSARRTPPASAVRTAPAPAATAPPRPPAPSGRTRGAPCRGRPPTARARRASTDGGTRRRRIGGTSGGLGLRFEGFAVVRGRGLREGEGPRAPPSNKAPAPRARRPRPPIHRCMTHPFPLPRAALGPRRQLLFDSERVDVRHAAPPRAAAAARRLAALKVEHADLVRLQVDAGGGCRLVR
jgi:hypothetical protein